MRKTLLHGPFPYRVQGHDEAVGDEAAAVLAPTKPAILGPGWREGGNAGFLPDAADSASGRSPLG